MSTSPGWPSRSHVTELWGGSRCLIDWPQDRSSVVPANGAGTGGSYARVASGNIPLSSGTDPAELEAVTTSSPAERAMHPARLSSPAMPPASSMGVLRARSELRSTRSSPRRILMFLPQGLLSANAGGCLSRQLRLLLNDLSAVLTPGLGQRRGRVCVKDLANGFFDQIPEDHDFHAGHQGVGRN